MITKEQYGLWKHVSAEDIIMWVGQIWFILFAGDILLMAITWPT